MIVHSLSAHVAEGYKLEPAYSRERNDVKWIKKPEVDFNQEFHIISSPKPFRVGLVDSNNKFIAMLHSVEVQLNA